jgi:hypothetical protein
MPLQTLSIGGQPVAVTFILGGNNYAKTIGFQDEARRQLKPVWTP